MIRATAVLAKDTWSQEPADSVVLEFDDRAQRHVTMLGVGGLSFLLDLPETLMLRSGDALALEDGRLVEVVAAPEPLVEVRGKSPLDLLRFAWQVGNRHLPAQILANGLRIRRDGAVEDLLRGLGATLRPIEAPFDPEGVPYATGTKHGHEGHAHGEHAHDHHDHGHAHKHHHGGHDHGHGHEHDHGHDDPGHNHAHGEHGHKHKA